MEMFCLAIKSVLKWNCIMGHQNITVDPPICYILSVDPQEYHKDFAGPCAPRLRTTGINGPTINILYTSNYFHHSSIDSLNVFHNQMYCAFITENKTAFDQSRAGNSWKFLLECTDPLKRNEYRTIRVSRHSGSDGELFFKFNTTY